MKCTRNRKLSFLPTALALLTGCGLVSRDEVARVASRGSLAVSSFFSKTSLRSCSSVIRSFQFRALDPMDDCVDDLLDLAFDAFELALGTGQAGALLHAKPVHLLCELATEFLEEILAHQLVFESAEDAFFDFLPRSRQAVRASATTAST